MSAKKIPQEKRDKIARAYRQGTRIVDICARYGVSDGAITRIAKEAGIALRGRGGGATKLKPEQQENLLTLYKQTRSLRRAGKAFGVGPGAARAVIMRLEPMALQRPGANIYAAIAARRRNNTTHPATRANAVPPGPESEMIEKAKTILRRRIAPVFNLGIVGLGEKSEYCVGKQIVDRRTLLAMAEEVAAGKGRAA